MSKLERLTKAEFDKIYEDTISSVQQNLTESMSQYLDLLKFKSAYLADYKTHRINHFLKDGYLAYTTGLKRVLGYNKSVGQEDGDEKE